MWLLDLTLESPEADLALDDALLHEAETADSATPLETLRLWEPAAPAVIVGRASKVDDEVDRAWCSANKIPVLRRTSGGCAIVTGPGCLMYAVVLDLEQRPHLRSIEQAHRHVLGTLLAALEPFAPGMRRDGSSDLVLGICKVSGNSLHLKSRALLYHGTLLYNFPLPLISQALKMPQKQPDYRAGREHGAFVANLPLTQAELKSALAQAWQAEMPRAAWPKAETEALLHSKYRAPEWNLQR